VSTTVVVDGAEDAEVGEPGVEYGEVEPVGGRVSFVDDECPDVWAHVADNVGGGDPVDVGYLEVLEVVHAVESGAALIGCEIVKVTARAELPEGCWVVEDEGGVGAASRIAVYGKAVEGYGCEDELEPHNKFVVACEGGELCALDAGWVELGVVATSIVPGGDVE
jgi:hypothetical protein